MRKMKGFKLGRKVVKVFKWVLKQRQKPSGYQRLDPPNCKSKTIAKFCHWGRCLKRGAKEICSSKYTRVGEDPFHAKPVSVPKGHLAVYVGQKDDDPHRFLVPVIYFNHPLFCELLREAEEEYGFHHSGGITIPCQKSEFEKVQTRIAAGESYRNLRWKRRL